MKDNHFGLNSCDIENKMKVKKNEFNSELKKLFEILDYTDHLTLMCEQFLENIFLGNNFIIPQKDENSIMKSQINNMQKNKSKIKKETRKMLNELTIVYKQQNQTNHIDVIRFQLKQCLDAFIAYNYNYKFTEDEIDELLNTAVFTYLSIWLENAKNTCQTDVFFVEQPYALSSEKERGKVGKNLFNARSCDITRIDRGLNILKDNIILQNEQAKKAGEHYSRIHYSKKKSVKYGFLDLCFADEYTNDKLELYKLFFLNKAFFENRSKNVSKYAIKEGYKQFYTFLKSIVNAKTDRLFVIKSMLFYKLEYTYRFLFTAKMGVYLKTNKIDVSTPIPDIIKVYCSRIVHNSWMNGTSVSKLLSEYDSLISTAYNGNKIDYSSKIIQARMLIDITLSLHLFIYPKRIYDDWTKEDFHNSALFLKNQFKIEDIIESLNISEFENDKKTKNLNSISDYIYKIYTDMQLIDADLLQLGRDNLKQKSMKRNKKKKRKKQK